jgi:type I restriction enzyme R subunit
VKLHSGDAIDLKQYEPAMRHLIDTYIRAEESVKVSEFDDLSLVQLIVERGADAVKALPSRIRKKEKAVAETIENNVRKLIIDESPINPKYYEKMSELLDALIAQRKEGALSYQEYLAKIVELTKQAKAGPSAGADPGDPEHGKAQARALRQPRARRGPGAEGRHGGADQHAGRLAQQRHEDQARAAGDRWRPRGRRPPPPGRRTLELVKSQNDY